MSIVIQLSQVPPGAAVRRRPGRPRKVHPALVSQMDYDAAVDAARHRHVDADPLVLDHPDELARMDALVAAVAAEAASLAWEARRIERRGGDASRVRSRRIEALVRLGELVRQRRGVDDGLRPELSDGLRALFLGVVREAAEETLGPAALGFLDVLSDRLQRGDGSSSA